MSVVVVRTTGRSGGSWPTTSSMPSSRRGPLPLPSPVRVKRRPVQHHERGDPIGCPGDRVSRWFRRFLLYLAAAGPGLIAASAGNDAGGVATYASAGSQFGNRTLFFMVLVTIAYVTVQEMVARLSVHTGKGLAALIREEFPLRMPRSPSWPSPWPTWAWWSPSSPASPPPSGSSGSPATSRCPSPPSRSGRWSSFGSYRYAERILLLMTLVFITYPIAMFFGHPDWRQVAANTLWPHFLASRAFLLLAVALIGTTITPYIQLYTAGAVVDQGSVRRSTSTSGSTPSAAPSSPTSSRCPSSSPPPRSSAAPGRSIRRPRRPKHCAGWPGRRPRPFRPGPARASALAAAVVPLSTSYAVAEAVGVERSVSKSFRQAPLFLGLFTAQILIGAGVVLVPGNLIQLIINTQVLEGVITPITLVFILVLANRRSAAGGRGQRPARPVARRDQRRRGRGFATFLVGQTVLSWFGSRCDRGRRPRRPARREGSRPGGLACSTGGGVASGA